MTAPVSDPSQAASTSAVYTDLSGLAALKRDARAQDPDAVRKVAKQFESVFAKMVLSSMRQASMGDSLFGSDQQQFYQGMFDDQLSVELTKGKGLGLADMLVQQLSKSGLVKGDAAATATDAVKKGGIPIGSSGSAGVKGLLPITGNGGAQSTTSTATGPASSAAAAAGAGTSADAGANGSGSSANTTRASTLLGMTDQSALRATEQFISKMIAGNAEAAEPNHWQAGSPEEFVQKLWPCAEAAGKQLGVDPKHLLAQAALETGWGKSLPCDSDGTTSYNFFGIKASGDWAGDSVSVKTLEFEGGVPVPKQAKFRAYDSPADAFRDYVSVLRDNPRYADALNTGKDAHAFAGALQRGGYATDPAYAKKIAAIVQNLPISETALKSLGRAPITPPIDLF